MRHHSEYALGEVSRGYNSIITTLLVLCRFLLRAFTQTRAGSPCKTSACESSKMLWWTRCSLEARQNLRGLSRSTSGFPFEPFGYPNSGLRKVFRGLRGKRVHTRQSRVLVTPAQKF